MSPVHAVLIPAPYRFNPWKHHLRWVQDCLCDAVAHPEDVNGREVFVQNVRLVNSNLVDVYCGDLTPGQIVRKVDEEIRHAGVSGHESFCKWLQPEGYRMVTVSDGSQWVLREGTGEERYIHVHPARKSPHIVRIHGNSWKTVLVVKLCYPQLVNPELLLINQLRKDILQLPPIKDTTGAQRLTKALELLGKSR